MELWHVCIPSVWLLWCVLYDIIREGAISYRLQQLLCYEQYTPFFAHPVFTTLCTVCFMLFVLFIATATEDYVI
jgi:carbon starvation protein CstA